MPKPSKLGRNEARRWAWIARGGAVVLVAGAAWAFVGGGPAGTGAELPQVRVEPAAGEPAAELPPSSGPNLNWIISSLRSWDPEQPRETGETGELTPPAPTPQGLRYLGAIRSGERVRALMASGQRQQFVGVGDSVDGMEVVRIDDAWVQVRDRGGERVIQKGDRTGPLLGALGSTRISDPRGEQDPYERTVEETGRARTGRPMTRTTAGADGDFSATGPSLRNLTGDMPAGPDGHMEDRPPGGTTPRSSDDDAEGT
jgi:hypothetical protein